MLFLPRALLTCFFFLAICAIADSVILLAMFFRWRGLIGLSGWPLWLASGIAWYLSFYCALRVHAAYFQSRLPPQFRH
jgi:hypothetical protein